MVIDGAGTPESVWQGWSRTFPTVSLDGCARLVVVAPHPDDEVLGAGGLMASALSCGVEVVVVAVTDGGASHPGSPTLSPERLAELRPHESAAALGELGVTTAPARLRLPDGAVTAHEVALARRLHPVLGEAPRAGTWVAATWRGDGHPDHEATGRAAATVCDRLGLRLLEYPVWTWHWSHPDDPRVPWSRAAIRLLDEETQRRKAAATRRFATQIHPLSTDPADAAVLTPATLARLLRPYEMVFQ